MKKVIRCALMVALSVAGLMSASVAVAATPDEQAVQLANDNFYTALNAMFQGNLKPMLGVWSEKDDVTYMGPDGKFTVGRAEVFADWQEQANKKLGGKVRPEKINAKVGQDLATVECYEIGENFVNGKREQVSLRATNVFRKENGKWKMIGHHTDKLPFMTK